MSEKGAITSSKSPNFMPSPEVLVSLLRFRGLVFADL